VYLVDTSYNPIPGKPKSGHIEVEVGVFLRYALWRHKSSSGKGTVLVLQGRTEYLEKNFELVKALYDQGHDVLAFDWRGQGGSSRLLENPKAGYVDSFDEYVADLMAIIAQVGLPDCRAPLHVLGHSTGTLVALLAAPRAGNKISRMVLTSPLLGLNNQKLSQGKIKLIAGALVSFGLGEVLMTERVQNDLRRKFDGNIYSSDRKRYLRSVQFSQDHPELCIGGATASWIFAACKAMEEVMEPDFIRQINVPILIINAGDDKVVNNAASERFASQLRLGSSLTIVGAQHELWQEQDIYLEQMLAAFNAFVPGSDKR